VLSANTTQKMTSLLILILLAAMWNALAGYGGLVSVGQQAFIGLGAYGTVWLVNHNMKPYQAMVVAALFCGALAVPLSFVVLRFRGAAFAIGMWVVAEVAAIFVSFDQSLGAGTGTSLIELNYYTPDQRQEYTYWLTLGMAVFFLGLLFVLLRSRLGTSLQAIRDDEEAAASLGVRVVTNKRILFVIAAAGCGAAGAMTLANTLFIEPTSIFGVDWTAYMIFMVLVGGLGTFEGPIVGALVLFAIQNEWADNGVWYLVGLGATAILFALLVPRGIWGTIEEKFDLQVMPVGYRLRKHLGKE
jgi:branched-chain amino acid transport system permease protein